MTALILCCFVGGQFLFAGVRGSESELGFLGLGFILVGLAIDAAATAIRTRHEHEVTLHLHRHNDAGSIMLGINRDDHPVLEFRGNFEIILNRLKRFFVPIKSDKSDTRRRD